MFTKFTSIIKCLILFGQQQNLVFCNCSFLLKSLLFKQPIGVFINLQELQIKGNYENFTNISVVPRFVLEF